MTAGRATRMAGSTIASAAVLVVAGVLVVALVSCSGRPPGQQPSAGEGKAPPVFTPVGPLPGPRADTARRENPFQSDRAAMAEGRKLFERFNCVGCHGGRAGGGMGPSLRDPEWRYGNSPAQIFSSIAEGRDEGMPSWGSTVTEEQTRKLVAYVQSLRTPNEPDRPQP